MFGATRRSVLGYVAGAAMAGVGGLSEAQQATAQTAPGRDSGAKRALRQAPPTW